MSIRYTESVTDITTEQLTGFFVGWPDPPSPHLHLKILGQSAHVRIAIDDETGNVVGFVNAVSDGFYSAFIPLLEVLPGYQGNGIGRELVRLLLDELSGFYSIDLCCDPPLQQFYAKCGLLPATGMMARNFARQNGLPND